MGALDIINNEIRTVAQTQAITVTNATNAVNATNATSATNATNATNVSGGTVSGNGSGLTNIAGANVTGTVANATNAATATNATQLGSVAATNYARKDSGGGLQTFANSIHVQGSHSVSGSTVGVSTTSNIGAFTGNP